MMMMVEGVVLLLLLLLLLMMMWMWMDGLRIDEPVNVQIWRQNGRRGFVGSCRLLNQTVHLQRKKNNNKKKDMAR